MKKKRLQIIILYLIFFGICVYGMENINMKSTINPKKKVNIEVTVAGLYQEDIVHIKISIDNNPDQTQTLPANHMIPAFFPQYVESGQMYTVELEDHITYHPSNINGFTPLKLKLDDIYHCKIYHSSKTGKDLDIETDKVEIVCSKKLWPHTLSIRRTIGYMFIGRYNIQHLICTFLDMLQVEFARPEVRNFNFPVLTFLPRTPHWILSVSGDGNLSIWNYKCMYLRKLLTGTKCLNGLKVCVSFDQKYIAAYTSYFGIWPDTLQIWNTVTGEKKEIGKQSSTEIFHNIQMSFVDEESLLLVGEDENKYYGMLLCNVRTSRVVHFPPQELEKYDRILFSTTIRHHKDQKVLFVRERPHIRFKNILQETEPKQPIMIDNNNKEDIIQEKEPNQSMNDNDSDDFDSDDFQDIPLVRGKCMREEDMITMDSFSITMYLWCPVTNTIELVKQLPDTLTESECFGDGSSMVLLPMETNDVLPNYPFGIWDLTSSATIARGPISINQQPYHLCSKHKLVIFNPKTYQPYENRNVEIWKYDTESQSIIPIQNIYLRELKGCLNKVTVSSDGVTIAFAGNQESSILFYDITTGEKVEILE